MKSTYNEILQNMKAAYNKEIGREIAENSIDEKKLEAIASELYGLSCYGDFILKQAFVQTATGEYLNRHGALRDCKRKLGTKAKGTLTFGINEAIASDIVIEKGTVCSKPNYPLIQYSTDETVILKAGNTSISVSCTALGNGEKYNLEGDNLLTLVNPPSGIEYAFNAYPITGGSDDESDGSFRKRIMSTFKIPLNYFNKSSIELEIKNIGNIKDCSIKQSDTPGSVRVIVSCPGELTSEELEGIKKAFPQIELFGVKIRFEYAKKTHVSIKVKANVDSISDEASQKQEIYDNIYEILTRNKINYNISLDEIRKAALKIDSVQSVEISGTNVLGDCILCDGDGYILLDNLEVELYEC